MGVIKITYIWWFRLVTVFFNHQVDATEADHAGDLPAASGGGQDQGGPGCQVNTLFPRLLVDDLKAQR